MSNTTHHHGAKVDRNKEILRLRLVEKVSLAEIARRMKISRGRVNQIVDRFMQYVCNAYSYGCKELLQRVGWNISSAVGISEEEFEEVYSDAYLLRAKRIQAAREKKKKRNV